MFLMINNYLEVQDFFFFTHLKKGVTLFLMNCFLLVNPEIKGLTQFSAGH